jgi:ATP-dependent helicase HrpB
MKKIERVFFLPSSSHAAVVMLSIRHLYRILMGLLIGVGWTIHVLSLSHAFVVAPFPVIRPFRYGSSVNFERNSKVTSLYQASNRTDFATHPDVPLKDQLDLALHQASDLPIFSVLDDIRRMLMPTTNDERSKAKLNMLLQAAPGAGKATVVPLRLLQQSLITGVLGKIILVAARRVAVRSAAQRMASMLGQSAGQTVGYAMREESQSSHHTRILVVTDGVMLNMLQQDPELVGVTMVILDEFHERGVGSDTALALTREVQRTLRENDLHILVMSATLLGDMSSPSSTGSKLLNVLGGNSTCSVIESEGRQYPIKIQHAQDIARQLKSGSKEGTYRIPPLGSLMRDRNLLTTTVADVVEYLALKLPGVAECKRVVEVLESRSGVYDDADVFALYGVMSKEEQDEVLYPRVTSRQRIVVSTPITEASVTLERVTCVVDCGLRREPRCDIDTGMPRLVSTRISKASAIQGAGRAGRVQEGLCLRLYTEHDFQTGFPDQSLPEISSTDLSPILLLLADWGSCSMAEILEGLPFVDPPKVKSLERVEQLLVTIGALHRNEHDDRFFSTDLGRRVSQIPCHPRSSTAIVRAEKDGNMVMMCAAIAVAFCLEEGVQRSIKSDPDIPNQIRCILQSSTRMEAFKRFSHRVAGNQGSSIVQMLKNNDSFESNALLSLGEALLPGFLDFVAKRKGDASYDSSLYLLSLGKSCRLDGRRNTPSFLVATETSTGPDGTSRIRSFAPIPKSILQGYSSERDLIYTVPSNGYEVRAKRIAVIGHLEISSSPLPSPSTVQVTEALLEAMTSLGGISNTLMKFTSPKDKLAVEELIARIQLDQELTKSVDQSARWPSWVNELGRKKECLRDSEDALRELLEPWLGTLKSLSELDVLGILHASFSSDQLKYLDMHYPNAVEYPDGSMIPITYSGEGPPKAMAKLQQFFGTTTTPIVGFGNSAISISISMLSPAGPPLAETCDLPFFWKEVYPSIRAEMRGRYPKHPWPEDPLSATATRKTKRQLNFSFPAQMFMLPFAQYTRGIKSLFSPTESCFKTKNGDEMTDEKFRQRNELWVILVDDEESIRLAVGDFLFEHGYQVTACADADSLLEVLRAEHDEGANQLPDAIISDIRMPLSTKNGYELVEAIRSAPQWTNIPIVMLTAKGMTQDRVQGYKVGADAFLPKPFDPNELLSILDNMIARNKQRMLVPPTDERSTDEAEPSSTPDLLVLKQQLDEIKEIMERNAASTVQKTNVVLTENERKMLQVISDGYTYSEVAKECDMSVKAVNRFVQKLHAQTETKTKTELVKWAIQVGYVS